MSVLTRLASGSAALGTIALLASAGLQAQVRWSVDPKFSLAWWQMSPHLNHLWATTCPSEPSWRPGEGRSSGWFINRWLRSPEKGDQNVADTINVPLYPRYAAVDVCGDDVRGEVEVADTVRWRGVRGEIAVRAAALVTGLDQRDEFAREAILEVEKYPEIRFRIDSLVDGRREADTLTGSVAGVFSLHGVDKPMLAHVRAWPEAGGLRVTAKLSMPARAIVKEYGLSTVSLGLGIGTRIWQTLFMGVDVVLRPTSGAQRDGTP